MRAKRRISITAVVIGALLLLLGVPSIAHGEFKFLDNTRKILYVYHDSVNPSKTLKKWIEQYFGGDSPVLVTEAPEGRYLGVAYQDNAMVPVGWVKSFNPAAPRTVAGCQDCPVAVLAFTNFRSGDFVQGPGDVAGIERIAGELEFAFDKMVEQGAAKVLYSTYHDNWSHRRLPEFEPLVVAAFRKRQQKHLAVDMVTPTEAVKSDVNTMAGDRRHVTHYTFALMAYHWLKAMCEHDGVPFPAWCDAWLQEAKDKVRENTAGLEIVSPKKGKFRVGDEIEVKFKTPCGTGYSGVWSSGKWDRAAVSMEFRRLDYDPKSGSASKEWADLYPKNSCPTGSRSMRTLCCPEAATGSFKFKVTADHVAVGGGKMPVPVNLMVHSPDLWQEHFATSNIDWQNPQNMIVLYPAGVDFDATIYPGEQTTHLAESGARGTMPVQPAWALPWLLETGIPGLHLVDPTGRRRSDPTPRHSTLNHP